MSYPRILSRLRSELWAITPDALESIYATLRTHERNPQGAMPLQGWQSRMAGAPVTPKAYGDDDEYTPSVPEPYRPSMVARGVALITVSGVIGKRLGWLESMCGGYDLDELNYEVDVIGNDPGIHSVIIDFDTPGGSVTGLWESAQKIAALSAVYGKHTVAYTETLRCSAGEYLASQCDVVTATRSATVGSVGTILSWVSEREAMKKEGLELIVFKGGQFKDMGGDHRPLTAEETALLQANVDRHYAEFKAMMTAKGRAIDDSTMQGQSFRGQEAQPLGLVDEVVMDLDEVIASLSPL